MPAAGRGGRINHEKVLKLGTEPTTIEVKFRVIPDDALCLCD
jgi:hypothetical protein